jgi:hypothetical protein
MDETGESSGGPVPFREGFVGRLSNYAANALRYWEPRRPLYNAVLFSVVALHVLMAWPASREKLSFDVLLGFFILAVIANVAYCAVYAADLFVQFSGLDAAWRRGRVVLLIVGTTFAATIAHFVTQGTF